MGGKWINTLYRTEGRKTVREGSGVLKNKGEKQTRKQYCAGRGRERQAEGRARERQIDGVIEMDKNKVKEKA